MNTMTILIKDGVSATSNEGMCGSLCHEHEAPVSFDEAELCVTTYAQYVNGCEGEPLNAMTGRDGGVLALLMMTILVALYGLRHSSRLFNTFTQDLWSTRRRENAFDDHTTSDSWVIMAMIFQSCVYQGLLLFMKIEETIGCKSSAIFSAVAAVVGLMIVFYLFQLTAVSVVGHVFSDKIGAGQWIKGFNASQILLGMALSIPALIALFYPEMASVMFFIAVLLYIIARVIFICKGFRIFYHNFNSLLYFILYLCTLEIIPVILVYSGAIFLVDLVQ